MVSEGTDVSPSRDTGLDNEVPSVGLRSTPLSMLTSPLQPLSHTQNNNKVMGMFIVKTLQI